MTHVHVVVDAEEEPEKVMNAFKVWASRRLNEMEGTSSDKRRWARHGSTRWLWKEESVRAAVKYVIEEQGERMEVYEEPGR
jgi:ribosomal protein L4